MRDVAAGDEGERDADAEDEGGDAVDERDEWRHRSQANFRKGKNDVIHDDVEGHAEESAVEPGAASERELTSGEKKDGCGAEGDDEVADEADEGGPVPHAKGSASVDAAGDALENSDGRHAAEAIEDEGVRDVECADEERGTGRDLPKWGVIR